MTYVWEALLKADEQGFGRENIRFVPAREVSPYTELVNDDINRDYVDSDPIEVNAHYRHSAVFGPLDGLPDGCDEFAHCLYDILMHLVAEVNLLEGLCRDEFYGLFLREDVESGAFGRQHAGVFRSFTRPQRRHVAEGMVRLYKLGPSAELFKTLMRKAYPLSITYHDITERKEILVYVGKKETPELRRQMDFLLSAFVPFDYVPHLFWDMHFGIFGVNETLELDGFVVY